MDNYIRGPHSYLGAGAKTSLGFCLTELLGPVAKKLCSPLLKLSMVDRISTPLAKKARKTLALFLKANLNHGQLSA
jgi:hypothetical protein